MAKLEITQAELLEAIAEASRSNGGEGQTTEEIVAATGLQRRAVLKALRVFKKQNRLSVVWVPRENITGSSNHIPAYTIKPQNRPRKRGN